MQVSIKSLDVQMDVKNNGVEFGVYDNQGNFLGDLIVNKTGLIWCKGKTSRAKGRKISWEDFIDWAEI